MPREQGLDGNVAQQARSVFPEGVANARNLNVDEKKFGFERD